MIAFISNTNMEPIRTLMPRDTAFAAFDQCLNQLLDETSVLYGPAVDTAVLFLSGEDLIKDSIYKLPDENLAGQLSSELRTLLDGVERYLSKKKNVTFVLSNIVFPPQSFISHLEANSPLGFETIETALNRQIKDWAAQRSNAAVLDWRRLVKMHGYERLTGDKFWYLGRIRLTDAGFSRFHQELESLLSAIRNSGRKVLVVDLDNTLWGGVCGEDGIGGIRLDEESSGKAYRDLQKAIQSLKNVGILLGINSKNNEKDVRDVFENHPMMVLKWNDFVFKTINWNDKADNLLHMSKELNLGLDSFVYLDDSPAERERIRNALPDVAVPEFPEDISDSKRWFYGEVVYRYFPKVHLTEEDAEKDEQYRRNAQRKSLAEKLVSIDQFIESLEIRLKAFVNDSRFTPRISQLTQKTNQFNLTTQRYSESQIDEQMKKANCSVFALDYEDKYGKEGIVGVAIVRAESEKAFIDTFLLSCRVLGRNVEYQFLAGLMDYLRKKGLRLFIGRFSPSPKNSICADFYRRAGFEAGGDGEYSSDSQSMRPSKGAYIQFQ